MNKSFKPMLAYSKLPDITALNYPLYASAKLDGIRAVVLDSTLRSRSLKPFPNRFAMEILSDSRLNGFDGELGMGPPTAQEFYDRTFKAVMSIEGEPTLTYYVFDLVDTSLDYYARHRKLQALVDSGNWPNDLPIQVVLHEDIMCHNAQQVENYESQCLDAGYEGLILRSRDGMYKFGRATLREQSMLKLKRFVDSEAVVVGYKEEMQNTNAAFINELGRTARSTDAAGMVGKGILGALECKEEGWLDFDVAGFTLAMKEQLWNERDTLIGRTVKYKYFPHGCKDRPRHPIFLGWRDPIDM